MLSSLPKLIKAGPAAVKEATTVGIRAGEEAVELLKSIELFLTM